jgi:hypothetical protein
MVWFTRYTNTSFNRREELSSRLLNDVFVPRVSQTIDYKRGVNGIMLSSRLLNDVFVSRVSQTIDYKRGVNGSMLANIYSTLIVYGLTHTGHEQII